MAKGGASREASSPRTVTVADLVTLKLKAERAIGNVDRQAQILQHIDELQAMLSADAKTDVSDAVSVIELEVLQQPHRYIALGVMVFVLTVVAAFAIVANLKVGATDTFLGYDLIFVLTAGGAGFLGSFVRVLNKIVTYAYFDMSSPTLALMMILRPVAGAALGLFVASVFAAGGVSVSLGDLDKPIFAGIARGGAFIFAVAFIAGLVDDFALSLADRFATMVRGTPSPSQQPKPKQE